METRNSGEQHNYHGLRSTHWTTVRACAGTDRAAQAARENLCRHYWYAIYAYIRRLGQKDFDAEDLTQDFLAYILDKPWFERADKSKGRFRSFLFASLDNFIRDRLAGRKAFKRGGGYQHIPLDLAEAELRSARTASEQISPLEIYELEWATALVDASWKRLESEYANDGKQAQFRELKCFLTIEVRTNAYEQAAQNLGISMENVKVCVHRLRKRYGAILRQEVALTVGSPADVESEMLHLRNAFAENASVAA